MRKILGIVLTGLFFTVISKPILGVEVASDKRVIESKTHSFEVNVDPGSNKISVQTLRTTTKNLPSEIELRFMKNGSAVGSVQLKALDLSEKLPLYQGTLDPNLGSQVGLELTFRLNGKKYRLKR